MGGVSHVRPAAFCGRVSTLQPLMLAQSSGKLTSASFRDQEPHGDHVENIQRRQQCDRQFKSVERSNSANHDGTKSTDTASDIKEDILCGSAGRGRKKLADKGAVTAKHSVDEEIP